jgi:acylphosphatase
VIRRRLLVRGRVQGVGFRIAVARRAEAAGLAGSARNRFDGSVEIVLEGAPEEVEHVAAFCAEGPRGAYVDEFVATDEPPQGELGFRVG